jgi:hypothetical protein
LVALSGGPLAGAPVEVQQLTATGERTIAQTTTRADGAFTAAVQMSFNQSLRALHRPGPATVSDLAPVGVAPAITLKLDSPSPLSVSASGAITPPKRSVTVDAYLLQNGHRQLITSKRVAVVRGGFRATLALRRRGLYVLRARSAADARNVAGASPTVTVTV